MGTPTAQSRWRRMVEAVADRGPAALEGIEVLLGLAFVALLIGLAVIALA